MMTAEEALAMPGAFLAYRRTDGELLHGEFSWMAEDYDCGHLGGDDTDELEEVVMVPVRVRVYPCHDQPPPDDDE